MPRVKWYTQKAADAAGGYVEHTGIVVGWHTYDDEVWAIVATEGRFENVQRYKLEHTGWTD